jgi:hypothetical protein
MIAEEYMGLKDQPPFLTTCAKALGVVTFAGASVPDDASFGG